MWCSVHRYCKSKFVDVTTTKESQFTDLNRTILVLERIYKELSSHLVTTFLL